LKRRLNPHNAKQSHLGLKQGFSCNSWPQVARIGRSNPGSIKATIPLEGDEQALVSRKHSFF
jgi:hypothetical protein